MPKMNADKEISLRNCARCGKTHYVEWKELTRQIRIFDQPHITHWAPCPINGEPILMRVIQEHVCVR